MSPEQVRLEALRLALQFKGANVGDPVDMARKYEHYIAGEAANPVPADTRKDEGAAAPQARKRRSAETPAT